MLAILSGCGGFNEIRSNKNENYNSTERLPGIPSLPDTKILTDESIILNSGEQWTGQAVLESPHSLTVVYNFYYDRMSKQGWKLITATKAKKSTLAFKNLNTSLIIQIENQFYSSNTSKITMLMTKSNHDNSEK